MGTHEHQKCRELIGTIDLSEDFLSWLREGVNVEITVGHEVEDNNVV